MTEKNAQAAARIACDALTQGGPSAVMVLETLLDRIDVLEANQARSMTDLWNAKCVLGVKIDEVVRPFLKEFLLQPQDIEINCTHAGCLVKVKL